MKKYSARRASPIDTDGEGEDNTEDNNVEAVEIDMFSTSTVADNNKVNDN